MLGPQRAVAGNAGLITCCKAASSAVQIASPEDAAPDIPLMGLPHVGPADLRSSANFQRRTRLYSHSLEQMETVLLSGRGWLGWLTVLWTNQGLGLARVRRAPSAEQAAPGRVQRAGTETCFLFVES